MQQLFIYLFVYVYLSIGICLFSLGYIWNVF